MPIAAQTSPTAPRPRYRRVNHAAYISPHEFADLIRLLHQRGVAQQFAIFAVPGRGVLKINAHSARFRQYADEYGDCFVGVYDGRVRAGALEDDLYDAGVRLVAGL